MATGNPGQAAQPWKRVLALRPDSVPLLTDFARLLVTQPDLQNASDATAMPGRAHRAAGGSNPTVLDVPAAADAASGRTDLAVRTAQSAFEQPMSSGNADLGRQIRQRLERDERKGSAAAGDRGIP